MQRIRYAHGSVMPVNNPALCRPAIEHFTQRVFKLPSGQFFPKHTLMLSTLRKALVPAELAQHMQRLAALMLQRLQSKFVSSGKVILPAPGPLFLTFILVSVSLHRLLVSVILQQDECYIRHKLFCGILLWPITV